VALGRSLLAVATVISVVAACSSGITEGPFCPLRNSYVYAPVGNECGTGITGLDVQPPCVATCDDPGYPPDCPGPCIVWKISASEVGTCRFTVHFTHAPDFSADIAFKTVVQSGCPSEIAGTQYTLPVGVATRSADASVETGPPPNDAAVEADATDASSDADDGAVADAGDAG
jgi:hypothetical protein